MLEIIEQEETERRLARYRKKMRAADIEYYILAGIIAYSLLSDLHVDHSLLTVGLSVLGIAFFIAPTFLAKKWPYATYTTWAVMLLLYCVLAMALSVKSRMTGVMTGVDITSSALVVLLANWLPVRAMIYAAKWHREMKQINNIQGQ